jgi:hypothetical protein
MVFLVDKNLMQLSEPHLSLINSNIRPPTVYKSCSNGTRSDVTLRERTGTARSNPHELSGRHPIDTPAGESPLQITPQAVTGTIAAIVQLESTNGFRLNNSSVNIY